MAKSNKVIICAALTGAVTPKEKSPNHPITPDEIAADVVRCAKAGAAAVHLHARDINAKGTMSADVFTEIFEKTKAACQEAGVDVIINLTTSGAMNCTKEERVAHIQKLKPEMMSYDVGSFNWDDAFIYDNSPDFLRLAGKVALECDVKPEIEVFDSGHIRSTQTYIKEGLLKAPAHYQFVLGVGGAMEGTIDNVVFLRNMLPEGATWSATGIGTAHMPVMYAALAAGCDMLRVGLEDNVYLSRGVKASNEALVKRAVQVATTFGREIATADEAREILGITRKSW